jgi:hypothetical protein
MFACDLFDCMAFKLDIKRFSKLFDFDFVYPIKITIETEYAYLSIRLLDFDLI